MVTVWFDGSCPLCRREIALMRRLDRRGRIDFVDASGTGNITGCPADRAALLARFHAREGDRLLSGAAAFAAMWRAIPWLRPLGEAARFPPLLALLELAYRGFLKVRPCPAAQDGGMSGDESRAVPRGRLARAGQFGRLAGGVAGGMLAEGARRLAAGERPSGRDLLLTPANLTRLADRLAHLRGAAMKLGQMISLDSGDFLPPELSDILARLRSNAFHMPPQQLAKVLEAEWGKDWRRRFKRFQAHPIAAASIGQVHRAETQDGRTLAIKVQYPGVAESIDADVDNVAALLRVSGLIPAELDIAPLLAEAKAQLAREADYVREGQQLRRYGQLLADAPEFVVPTLDESFTTTRVLAMSFVESRPIEALDDAPQEQRNAAMTRIVGLVLRELFEFGVMQTDPNYANYRLLENGRIALLDFGAAQDVPAAISEGYRTLLGAALAGDAETVKRGAVAAGFIGQAVADRHGDALDRMVGVVLAELHKPGPFDFGDRAFLNIMREEGMSIAADKASWHLPPADLLFVQRKVSGTALLGARFKAQVDVRSLIAAALAT